MRKGISPIISTVMLILISISAIYLALNIIKPAVERAYEQAAMNEADQNMQLLDNLIREVASEGTGSSRTVYLKVSDGNYRVINTSGNFAGAFQFKIELKHSPFSAPMLKRVGNLKYSAGMDSAGLVGYWKFDEGSENITYDSSGYGNNGTLLPGVIDDFNDGDYNGWTLNCGGAPTASMVAGYEAYAFRIWPTGGDGLACALKNFNATAGQSITFACRGNGSVCRMCVYNGSQCINSGDGASYHTGDGNWHIYSTNITYTQNNVGIYIYSNGLGSWAEYDFITLGPMWTDGKIGKALSFDGMDDYVEVPNAASLNITEDITIGAWAYRSSTGTFDGILGKDTGIWDNSATYQLLFNNGNFLEFRWESSSGKVYVSTTTTFGANQWYHVVAKRWKNSSGNYSARIYVNGNEIPINAYVNTGAGFVLTDKDSLPGPAVSTIGTLRIGQYGKHPITQFGGTIDEARIYNRALSAEEIKENYDAKASNYQVVLEYGKIILTGNLRLGKGTHKLCIEKIGELSNKPLIKITAC